MTIDGCFHFSRKGRAALTDCTVWIMSMSKVLLQSLRRVLQGERGDIGDENVNSAERLRAFGDEFLQRGLVGHVDVRSISVHAFSREILDRGLHLVGVTGADRDACAFRAKISAAARPMPLVPPVTTARRPFNPRSMFSSVSSVWRQSV